MIHTFPDLKILFIKVPATGGGSFWLRMRAHYEYRGIPVLESIKKMRDINNKNLYMAIQARAAVGEDIWNEYEKIGFIRHPVNWLNSIYYKPLGAIHYGIDESNNGLGRMPFSDFVRDRINKTPYDWFTDDKGKVIIDTIYRTEDLNDVVFPRFNVKPYHYNERQNKLRNQDMEPSSEDMKIIRKKFHREFKHYP